ncbi:MAG TPA: hypothetical protein VD997_01820 [Phycisphaerales bacterium]|nr:hypothetical protein [Phycisphaerales bacterium]
MPPNTLQLAADRLGNSLRLYAESSLTTPALAKVDLEEAVDNHDRAFDGVLGAMASAHDALGTSTPKVLNFYAFGDTTAVLLVRNARHHNTGGLFQSWNALMLKHGGLKQRAGAEFLMVDYTLLAGEGTVSRYYLLWDDFRAVLADPTARIRDRGASAVLLDQECGFDAIRVKAAAEGYPANQVFVNLVPIIMNAATRVFAAVATSGTSIVGFDSGVYSRHFASGPLADLRKPTFTKLRAPLA